MIDAFLLIGLPYLAIVVCVIGTIWRWRSSRFSVSSLSSQFLENRQLLWGSVPWHIGILIVLLGHIVAFIMPGVWHSLMSHPTILITTEVVGVAAAVLSLVGLVLLLVRRLTSGRVQAVTTTMDLLVLFLLILQVLCGLLTATMYPYGAAWATGSLAPYIFGIFTLSPDMTYVADLPVIIKAHIIGAWLFFLALPFSRLVHLLALPLQYLFRAPQLVLWNNARRRAQAVATLARVESRREFIKGAVGMGVVGALMSVGVLEKLFRFFRGPQLEGEQEAALLEKKLTRLKQTAEQRALELERQKNQYILVARYTELDARKGKYFIDYAMSPALAFLGADGLPLLISAKCTHLGCTVSNEADNQGRVLCPCHISYFNISTGEPNAGAPAKDPLHPIAWAVLDPGGNVLVGKGPGGPVQGSATREQLKESSVYIVKPSETTA
jgi:nitrate reductase gamma subunit